MIFVGDIAIPYKGAIKIVGVPEDIVKKKWFGNLEGAVVTDGESKKKETVVFNDREGILELLRKFDFTGFALANNHIFDTGSYDETTAFLNERGVPFVGIGEDTAAANAPLVLKDGDKEVVILNFGWEVIQCEVIDGMGPGVNPLRKSHVLATVERALNDYSGAYVLPFMHWSYELEDTPQPLERQLAKKLIDIGAAGVIGCHPHRIGGFELYNDRPIVYSLGNWLFKQKYYHDGRLRFPDFCNQELALEWDFVNNEVKFHFFDYDRENSILKYSHSEGVESETMNQYTPFRGLSTDEYNAWYKKNHFHRNKGLPIYYWDDSDLVVILKNAVNKVRDLFVSILSKLR